jgi:hypothetical protein
LHFRASAVLFEVCRERLPVLPRRPFWERVGELFLPSQTLLSRALRLDTVGPI